MAGLCNSFCGPVPVFTLRRGLGRGAKPSCTAQHMLLGRSKGGREGEEEIQRGLDRRSCVNASLFSGGGAALDVIDAAAAAARAPLLPTRIMASGDRPA